MAQNSSDSLAYYLVVDKKNKRDLSKIRSWKEIKVAFNKNEVWLTNFSKAQVDSNDVKSIPFKKMYYSQDGKLFLLNSLLPAMTEPSFLWTPIARALPIVLPQFNHNFFGIEEKISPKLIKSKSIQPAKVMLIPLENLIEYVINAPKIRLKNLRWVVINNKEALIFGKPLLPINGDVFWVKCNMIIPVGWDFKLSNLTSFIEEVIDSSNDHWIIWSTDTTYFLVEKILLRSLSISSVRKTNTRIIMQD